MMNIKMIKQTGLCQAFSWLGLSIAGSFALINSAHAMSIDNLAEACYILKAPSYKCKSWEIYAGTSTGYQGKRLGLIHNVALIQGHYNKFFITQTRGDGFSRKNRSRNASETGTHQLVSGVSTIARITEDSWHQQGFDTWNPDSRPFLDHTMSYSYSPEQQSSGRVSNSIGIDVGGSFDGAPGISVGLSASNTVTIDNLGIKVDSQQHSKRWTYNNPNASGHGFDRAVAWPSLSGLAYIAETLESSQTIRNAVVWQIKNAVTSGARYWFETKYSWKAWDREYHMGVPGCGMVFTKCAPHKIGPDLRVRRSVYLDPAAVSKNPPPPPPDPCDTPGGCIFPE